MKTSWRDDDHQGHRIWWHFLYLLKSAKILESICSSKKGTLHCSNKNGNIFFFLFYSDQKLHMHLPKYSPKLQCILLAHMLMTSPLTIIFPLLQKNLFHSNGQEFLCWHLDFLLCSLLLPSATLLSFLQLHQQLVSTSQMSHWEFVYWQYKTDGILSAAAAAVAKKLLSLDKKSVSMEKVVSTSSVSSTTSASQAILKLKKEVFWA